MQSSADETGGRLGRAAGEEMDMMTMTDEAMMMGEVMMVILTVMIALMGMGQGAGGVIEGPHLRRHHTTHSTVHLLHDTVHPLCDTMHN